MAKRQRSITAAGQIFPVGDETKNRRPAVAKMIEGRLLPRISTPYTGSDSHKLREVIQDGVAQIVAAIDRLECRKRKR